MDILANQGYKTFTMPSTVFDGHYAQTIQSDCICHAGNDWTCNHVGDLSLGRQRRQLSHCAAIFLLTKVTRPKPFPGRSCFGCSLGNTCNNQGYKPWLFVSGGSCPLTDW